MQKIDYFIPKDLEPYINCIMIQDNKDDKTHTNMPFYADGYPGIMFQQSKKGFYILPHHKKLSELFLFGQTIAPISLDVKGSYECIIFQLYPFASKYLLGIDPKKLNDDCYDLLNLTHLDISSVHEQLKKADRYEVKVDIITALMRELITYHAIPPNDKIQLAISIIIEHKGQIAIKKVLDQLHITERTLERHFKAEIGLSPKQFAKIIQFQCSLSQLNQTNYDKLVEVGYDSGFTDQSHFIKSFKKYTGQTPSYYLHQSTL